MAYVLVIRHRARDTDRSPLLSSGRDVAALVGFGTLGVALFYFSYLYAAARGGAGFAAILLYTAPGWVLLIETLWPRQLGGFSLREKSFILLIAFLGVAFVSGGWNLTHGPALLAGLIAGACYSLYYLLDRLFSDRITKPQIFAGSLLVGSLLLLPFVDFTAKTPVAWMAIASISIVSTFLAYLFFALALDRVGDPTLVASVAMTEPIFAAVFDYKIWGVTMSPPQYFGFALILGAGLLVLFKERRTSAVED